MVVAKNDFLNVAEFVFLVQKIVKISKSFLFLISAEKAVFF